MARTVLVVDDNAMNRILLRGMLSGTYEVLLATDGKEAMDTLLRRSTSISAVLLDIIMPVMDGYEVLELMRSNAALATLPVIMITGVEDELARARFLSLGANDFVMKPYNPDVILHCLANNIALHETTAAVVALQRDRLTGLYNREAFFEKVHELVTEHEPGYYVMAGFDIDKFKVINDQYGTQRGDEVLLYIADVFREGFDAIGGICCRMASDDFAVLYPTMYKDSSAMDEIRRKAGAVQGFVTPVAFSVGRYVVDDLTLSPSAMYDRAMLALDSVKGRYDVTIACYDESLRMRLLGEQLIVTEMENALRQRQFEVWYQPQYNHATHALIGAEALVRWRHPVRGLISPAVFIPIFEKNGFIYTLDRYVWEEACRFLRRELDAGGNPPPVSVNISRYDLFCPDMVECIVGLTRRYELPAGLLRLEITESAFAESTTEIVRVVKRLIDLGFTLEIDDFGSGYSSLNTLKSVAAQVIKLDMRFFEDNDDAQRSGNIIESVVRMTKWLGMSVIAEGVERREQADFLQSVGCDYIQGYLYAKPMPADSYARLCAESGKEATLHQMETVDNLDNNAFWDPKSMETLIFNSYVGGASIFEYHNGKTEVVRHNADYDRIFSGDFAYDFTSKDGDALAYLDSEGKDKLYANIRNAIESNAASSCEVCLTSPRGTRKYLRAVVRVIARAGDRYLLYAVLVDVTEQRAAEVKVVESAQRLQAIMDNIHGGVSAIVMEDEAPRLLFANDRFFALLGYSREQFDGELDGVFGGIHSEDRARVLREAGEASRTGLPLTTTYRVARRDGSVRWMQSNVSITSLPGVELPVQLAVITDVTTERENARMMDELLNAIPGGVVIYRVGETIETLYSSDGVAKLTGISDDEYAIWQRGDLIATAIDEDDAPRVRAQIMAAVQNGSPVNLTFRLKHVNGGMVWVAFSASMIREDAAGKIYYGIFTKPATEAALYQSLVEDSPTAAIILEKKSRKVLYANPAWRRIEGVPDSAVITGVPLMEIIPQLDRFLSEQELRDLPADRFIEKHEISLAGKNVTANMRSVLWNGVDAYMCYMNDESELWTSRQRLQHLIDRVPVGIAICQIKAGKLSLDYVNDEYYRVLGFKRESRQAFMGANVIDAIYEADRALVAASLQDIRQGSDGLDVPYRTLNSDGELVCLRIQASVIERKRDEITVYCGITRGFHPLDS